ncbi:hypothetical protein AXF42_Ash011668 [Apostasia shenzhenica]|uniref:Uncharacterized protein n=1 Tax=Apostasia shenzhenica TaxID=1088818 RepID=A0A2H9ZUM4_9ASPA|nr:hypothetical protein AXF42_Ash011668 [Apostasia shenzhenica]
MRNAEGCVRKPKWAGDGKLRKFGWPSFKLWFSMKIVKIQIDYRISAPKERDESNKGYAIILDIRESVCFIAEFKRSTLSIGFDGFAELDDPFVKLRLQEWFWHQRTTVLARLANYMKNWIPEILEVEIEDEKQLDDSSENFLRYNIEIYDAGTMKIRLG